MPDERSRDAIGAPTGPAFQAARLTTLTVLCGAMLIHYRDAGLWKSFYYGPFSSPIHLSLYALLAGAMGAAAWRLLRRAAGRTPPLPGPEELWMTLAAGAVTAHALAMMPGWFSIDTIGFPPVLAVVLLLLPAAGAAALLGGANESNRPLTCAAFTLALTLFASIYHVTVDRPFVGGAVIGVPHWMIGAAGILCLLTWLRHRGTETFPRFPRWGGALACGFLGMGLLATIFALDKDHSFEVLYHAAAGAAMMLVTASAVRRERGARTLFWVFGLGGIAVACIAVLSVLFAWPYSTLNNILKSQLHVFHTHPNVSSVFFSLAALVLLGLGSTSRRTPERGAAFGGALLCALCLLATHSRAGMLGFAGGTALFVFLFFAGARLPGFLKRGMAFLVPAGAALLLVACLFSSVIVQQFKGSLRADTIDFRTALWSAGLNTVQEYPLTGVGLCNYIMHSKHIEGRQTKLPYNIHPHSLSLHVAEGMGVPALLFLAGLIFIFLRRALRAALAPGIPPVARTFLLVGVSSLLAVQIANIFDQIPECAIPDVFWFFWGAIAGLSGSSHEYGGLRAPPRRCRSWLPWLLPPAALLAAGLPAWTRDLQFRCAADHSPSPERRIQWLQRCQRLRPFNTEIPFKLAFLLYEDGRIGEAIASAEKGEPFNAYNAMYWDFRGQLYFKAERYEEAGAAFEAAVSLDASSAHAPSYYVHAIRVRLLLQETFEAERLLRYLFETFPEETVNALRREPEAARQMAELRGIDGEAPGDLEGMIRRLAVACLDEAFGPGSRLPEDRTLDLGRFVSAANAYTALGETEKAIALVERCLGVFPDGMPRLEVLLGWLHTQASRVDEGIQILEKVLPDARFGLRAANCIFEVLHRTPRMSESLETLEIFAAKPFDIHFKSRDNREAGLRLAKGYLMIGRLDEAVEAARSVIFFSPKDGVDPEAWFLLTTALARMGRAAELLDEIMVQARLIAVLLAENPLRHPFYLERIDQLAEMAASLLSPGRMRRPASLEREDLAAAARALPDNLVRALFLAFADHRLGLDREARQRLDRAGDRYGDLPMIEKARERIKDEG